MELLGKPASPSYFLDFFALLSGVRLGKLQACIERTNEKRSSLTACKSRRRRNLLRAAAHTKRHDGAYRAARCTTTQRRRGAQVRSCMSGLAARCMLWLHLKRVDVPFAAFTSVLSSPTLATIRSRSDAVGKGTLLLQEAYYSVAINTKLCGSLI